MSISDLPPKIRDHLAEAGVVSTTEICKLFGFSREHLQNLIKRGKIPYHDLGAGKYRKPVFTLEDIEIYWRRTTRAAYKRRPVKRKPSAGAAP